MKNDGKVADGSGRREKDGKVADGSGRREKVGLRRSCLRLMGLKEKEMGV